MAGTTIPTRAVGHVRDALHREFDAHIDLSDLENKQLRDREQAFRSRALAALLVRNLTDCDNETAAASVIDGRDDGGIDAAANTNMTPRTQLIQTRRIRRRAGGFAAAVTDEFDVMTARGAAQ